MDRERRTTFLGRWDDLEIPIVLEILADAGIAAFAKEGPENTSGNPYPHLRERGGVLVDAQRAEEARRLVDRELPLHLDAIRRAMEEQQDGP